VREAVRRWARPDSGGRAAAQQRGRSGGAAAREVGRGSGSGAQQGSGGRRGCAGAWGQGLRWRPDNAATGGVAPRDAEQQSDGRRMNNEGENWYLIPLTSGLR